MGFTPPVPQDDSDWEIRVAMLLSLFLQMILIFVGPVRKRSSSTVPRLLVWSCYLLADWVADLALGLLLNNIGDIGRKSHAVVSDAGGNATNSIFAFWTPFLLLHLGGPDTITAYSLADNELWLRHLIGLLFELFSACVIFFCSLKAGNPMIPATVLMFVVGIIKYGERTFCLYSGSVDGFRESILDPPDPGPNYAKLMTEFDAKERAGLDVEVIICGANSETKKALAALEQGEATRRLTKKSTTLEAHAFDFFLIFRRLFVNLIPIGDLRDFPILGSKEAKISTAYFLEHHEVTESPATAFAVIELELNLAYDMLYTKAPVAHSKAGCILRLLASACLASSLLIFFFHRDKGGIMRVDVAITYALLLGGLALDAAALAMLLSSHRTLVFLERTRRLAWLASAVRAARPRLRRWSQRTSQLNLVSYCLGKPDRLPHPRTVRALARVAETLHVRKILDDFFFIRREPLFWSRRRQREQAGAPLLIFLFVEIKARAMKAKTMYIDDEAIRKACAYRGLGALEQLRQQIMENLVKTARGQFGRQEEAHEYVVVEHYAKEVFSVLMGSVKKDFDSSLLLWHIATDLCCHHSGTDTVPTEATCEMRMIGETLSEYMLYVLVNQSEMLSATAGIGLLRYRDTCAEAKRFFESAAVWDPDHVDVRRMLLSVNTSKEPSALKGNRCKSVLFDAVILAKALRYLDDDLMWEVVARVWGEMLTYAAAKCRGSTHVRQLSRGGELITMVWLLMAHMGLSDMYRTDEEEDAKAKLIVRDQ